MMEVVIVDDGNRLTVYELVERVIPCIIAKHYSENYIQGFRSTFRNLLAYCNKNEKKYFTAELAQQFMLDCYGVQPGTVERRCSRVHRAMDLLSDYQHFNAVMLRRRLNREFPAGLQEGAVNYLQKLSLHGRRENTLRSHRNVLLRFTDYLFSVGVTDYKLLSADIVNRYVKVEFLQYLETERKYSISSRNQRLAALKSFAKYVQIECPDEMILCQRILSIDSKKAAKPTVQYLSIQQTDILMEQPDISTPKGRRDLAMILLLYDSAARVQELCDLRICDIRLDSLPVVHLLGKGRKSRDVPLTKPCAQVLRQYICENHLDIPERRNDQLFINPQGKKLTRSGVSYVLAKYIHKANTAVDSFFPQITPHCLRHSKAMHLVEAGKNLIYIRDFLGHESIETTQVYAKANPEARRKALETMDTRMNTPAMPDWNDDPDLKAFLKTL